MENDWMKMIQELERKDKSLKDWEQLVLERELKVKEWEDRVT